MTIEENAFALGGGGRSGRGRQTSVTKGNSPTHAYLTDDLRRHSSDWYGIAIAA